jgi:hypothetical protein
MMHGGEDLTIDVAGGECIEDSVDACNRCGDGGVADG